MKATLQDKVFGKLTWNEDEETYSGKAEFQPGRIIPVAIRVFNADEMSTRELTAFFKCAQEQFQRLQKDDGPLKRHAGGLFKRALKKAAKKIPDDVTFDKQVALADIAIDNAGITQVWYNACELWPKKNVTFCIDGSDRVV